MTKRIVPGFLISETCPAPECNLSEHDVEQFVGELETYFELLAPAFHRCEQFVWGEVYLKGLLGDAQRKTSERIALDSNKNVRNLQHFIGQS
ncbi:MAG: transposase, partial [Caldilinea sp.]|nr:transposase [Caldilinea sp.]